MSNVNYHRLTSVKSILQAAVNLLQTVGWIKGHMRRKNMKGQITGYCAHGAIISVSRNDNYAYRAVRALQATRRIQSIIQYNDRKTTTKRDIVSAFKKAIAKA